MKHPIYVLVVATAMAILMPVAAARSQEAFTLRERVDRLIRQGDYARALRHVEAKADTFRGRADADDIIEDLAEQYVVAGLPEQAGLLLQSLEAHGARVVRLGDGQEIRLAVDGEHNARLESDIGWAYRRCGDHASAVPHFRAAQRQNRPNQYLAVLAEAECLMAVGRLDEADQRLKGMVDEKVTWWNRAEETQKVVASARAGTPADQLNVAYHFQGKFRPGDPSTDLSLAVVFANKVLAAPGADEQQRTMARQILDRVASALANPKQGRTPRPPIPDVLGPAGRLADGAALEAAGKFEAAFGSYKAHRNDIDGWCGTGMADTFLCNSADVARVAYRAGRKAEAVPFYVALMGAGPLNSAEIRAVHQFVVLTRDDPDSRRDVLAGVKADAAGLAHYRRLIDLEAAVAKKDAAAALAMEAAYSDRDFKRGLPDEVVAGAVARMGSDAVPELLRRLEPGRPGERPAVSPATLLALRQIRDPRAVRPLWKAHLGMTEFFDVLDAHRKDARRELIGWLDSDDPVQFAGAVKYLFTPLDPDFWPPARGRLTAAGPTSKPSTVPAQVP